MGHLFASNACLEGFLSKRNTIKKVKFHSWGGKRSGGQTTSGIPASRSNNGYVTKDLGQSKIVIRTPFRPWGGKRNNLNDETTS